MKKAATRNPASGRRIRSVGGAVALAFLAAAATASAQTADITPVDGRSYIYGNLTYVEGDVWHQRADDFGANEAERNSPFLPGDRIWTREEGQVEFRLAGGVLVWMDAGTKLDYVEADNPHRLGFWTGSLALLVPEDVSIVIETPGGTLTPQGAGEFRTDLLSDARTVQFQVYEGIATVATEWGSVLVGAGQRTLASEGAAPAPAEKFLANDTFLGWTEERRERILLASEAPLDELPEEVHDHIHDLDGHGRWRHDPHLGWQWFPFVSAGWAPYRLGRWAYTPFGYTWISHDPWGWAPFHYGSWGHGPYGWYWMPGSVWGPGWVSWAYGPNWVSWGPLNYYGRPVYGFHGAFYDERYYYSDYYGNASGFRGLRRGQILGKAVPRGDRVTRRGWSATTRASIGTPASARRLAMSRLQDVDKARVLSRGATLDRGFRLRADGATGMLRSARATNRRLSNAPVQTATGEAVRRTNLTQRIAQPAPAARARSGSVAVAPGASRSAVGAARVRGAEATAAGAGSSTGARATAAGRVARPAAASRGTATSRSGASRASRPPRPRASGSASGGARRPSAVRPSGASRGSASRPSATSRGRPSASAPSRSGARPSSGAASRGRPSSGARSRPSATSRSRPSASSRSRPSGSIRGRPSATPRSSGAAASRSTGGWSSRGSSAGASSSGSSGGSRSAASSSGGGGSRGSSSGGSARRRPNNF